MDLLRISSVMTPSPHSIGLEQSLAEGAKRMLEHEIRHLPVLHGGELRGILSDRDIALVEALGGVDPQKVTVEEAMTPEPYTVAPDTPLSEVIRAMADRKYGCAVVMEGPKVIGVLTTTDALRILWERLAAEDTATELAPGRVRDMIAAEHLRIRRLLDAVDHLVKRGIAGDEKVADELRERGRHLYETMGSHIELENRVLAPALRETAGFGEIREKQLLEHHAQQRQALEKAVARLKDGVDIATLAHDVSAVVAEIRLDMAHEDKDLLDPNLLKDDPIQVDFLG